VGKANARQIKALAYSRQPLVLPKKDNSLHFSSFHKGAHNAAKSNKKGAPPSAAPYPLFCRFV
jgi:hypothetical protein